MMSRLALLWAELLPLAAASGKQSSKGQGPNILSMLTPLLIMFAIIYFLVIMPQKRKQRQRRELLSTLKKNDRVITVGGIHGVIAHVRENNVVIEVDKNTRLTLNRSGIAYVVSDEDEAKDAK